MLTLVVGQVLECKRGKEWVAPFRVDRVGSLYVHGTGLDGKPRCILRSSIAESGPRGPYRVAVPEPGQPSVPPDGSPISDG